MKVPIICLTLLIAGCSGQTIKTPVFDKNGDVVKNMFGGIAYRKERLSRTAVITQAAAQKSIAASQAVKQKEGQCSQIMSKTPGTAQGESEQFRAFSACISQQSTSELVAVALGRPRSDVEAIEQNTAAAIRITEENQTARTGMIGKYASGGLLSLELGRTVRNGQNAQAAQSISAGENAGDITANIESNQTTTSSSGTAGQGAGGESGSGTGGDSVAGSSTTTSGDQFIVGRNITSYDTAVSDNGRAMIDTNTSQILEPNANGAVNQGVNIDQQPIMPGNTGNLSNDPTNGSNNGTF